jgi:hypothetical protein
MANAEFHQQLLNQWDTWKGENISRLKREFSEARVLRLASTKPKKLSDLQQARQALLDIFVLRLFLRDTPHEPIRAADPKPKRGWNVFRGHKPENNFNYYWASRSKIAKFEMLIEDLDERIEQLEAKERQAAKVSMQFVGVVEDKDLAGALWHALETAPQAVGYVYLKRWTMPNDSCWYKVGITNNPDRRETEQNVLPVASETIACVESGQGTSDRGRYPPSASGTANNGCQQSRAFPSE